MIEKVNGHDLSEDEVTGESLRELLTACDCRPWPETDKALGNLLTILAGWAAVGPVLYFVGWWLGWV